MPKSSPFSLPQISRRSFLEIGALSIAGLGGSNFLAHAGPMTPLPKRDPTNAERQAVMDYHHHGKIVFQDDFRTPQNFANNWAVFTDNRPDLAACRTSRSLSTSDKGLEIETISTDHCKAKWSTGEIISKRAFQYGLYEAYMKAAPSTGTDNAFWLTSQGVLNDGSGDSFEIDIAEVYYPALIRATLHRHNLTKHRDLFETGYNENVHENLAAGFHDYGVLWTPTALVFSVDAVAYQTIETQGTINVPANLRLSMALASFAGAVPKDPAGLTMEVAHVRVAGL